MPNAALPRQVEFPPETRDPAVLVDVVVLSADMLLFDAIRAAIGERNPVWRARSAEESVDLLLTGRCGVLLIDLAAVSTQSATLVEQISQQFPDVVIVVAGRREDEALLAKLISNGLVYRFMHKPLSAKRAGMFLHAATRCHVERRDSSARHPLLTLAGGAAARSDHRKWLFVMIGVALFAGLIALLPGGRSVPVASEAAVTPAVPAPAGGTRRQADPVLSRARAAFQAGRYESPAGRNALDLYAAVLLADQAQPEAREGLDKTVAKVVAQARTAAASGDAAEAQRLLARLQATAPGNAATGRLAALLAPRPAAVVPDPPLVAGDDAMPWPIPAAPASTVPALPPATMPLTTPVTSYASPARPKPPATRPTIGPDPLAAQYSNAGQLASVSAAASRRRSGSLTPGAPVRGLPTAGYVMDSRPEASAAQPAAPDVADTGAIEASTLPADSLGRVVVTDPVYPASARQNRVEGWVELVFTISETGTVRDVEVVGSEPQGVFDTAATQAVSSWRYQTRLANGQPVARRTSVTLRFSLDD
jgi:TonB family protein